MVHLAVANVTHHKLRSALSAAGIGIGVCMLVVLSGLGRGTVGEIGDRWQGVDADLIVYPRIWGDNITTLSGLGLSDSEASDMMRKHGALIERIVPVFIWQMKIKGQDNAVVGVDNDETAWRLLTRNQPLREGHWPDARGSAADWLRGELLGAPPSGPAETQPAAALTEEQIRGQLATRGGFEMVVDSRLAAAKNIHVGDTVETADQKWKITGIVPAGALGRAFIPRRTAQYLFAGGNIRTSTLMFVKLRPGASPNDAAGKLETFSRKAVPLSQYSRMLESKFNAMFVYMDIVSVVAMVIAFLFIMITLYTMVLQRTREIAVLRSCGASGWFILRQVLAESALLTAGGAGLGLALTPPAAWLIGHFAPLYTVTLTWKWVGIAAGVALAGALAAAVYPAWRAMRVDVAEALTLE